MYYVHVPQEGIELLHACMHMYVYMNIEGSI